MVSVKTQNEVDSILEILSEWKDFFLFEVLLLLKTLHNKFLKQHYHNRLFRVILLNFHGIFLLFPQKT